MASKEIYKNLINSFINTRLTDLLFFFVYVKISKYFARFTEITFFKKSKRFVFWYMHSFHIKTFTEQAKREVKRKNVNHKSKTKWDSF